jgi:hypothetical protein
MALGLEQWSWKYHQVPNKKMNQKIAQISLQFRELVIVFQHPSVVLLS